MANEYMSFSSALILLKEGIAVQRKGWNGKGMYIFLFNGCDTPDFFVLEPHIVMFTADEKCIPWLASQSDLLANDWGPRNGE